MIGKFVKKRGFESGAEFWRGRGQKRQCDGVEEPRKDGGGGRRDSGRGRRRGDTLGRSSGWTNGYVPYSGAKVLLLGKLLDQTYY